MSYTYFLQHLVLLIFQMFAFPAFNPEKDVIANKSFMLADKMDAKWSADSKSCLLLMQCEVDKTG